MLTVQIPNSAYYECTQYLEHNGQFPNVEYTLFRNIDHTYTFSFRSKDQYLAFCSRWSRIIL